MDSQTTNITHFAVVFHYEVIYEMNFTLCVLLVYNDNGSVQTLCITRGGALCTKCLHRPIVIINQNYTKGEIHFIFTLFSCVFNFVLSIVIMEMAVFLLKIQRYGQ